VAVAAPGLIRALAGLFAVYLCQVRQPAREVACLASPVATRARLAGAVTTRVRPASPVTVSARLFAAVELEKP
jgi:hypothetical protein